jgi:hypothetical protein
MTTWTLQDLPYTPEEDEAFKKLTEEQEQREEDKPRSFWNHRLVRMPADGLDEDWLEIQEVYYNDKGEPCGYCNATAGSETLEGVALQVERFAECLKLPILNATTDFDNKWDEDYAKEY